MAYQLNIKVEHEDFGDKAGISRQRFEGDSLVIYVDTSRLASRQHFAAAVSNEINTFISAINDRRDNLTVAELVHANRAPMPFLDEPLPIEQAIADAKAAEISNGTPTTREYDVMWRRPTAAYAHDIVEATSLEDALMKAKTRVTSNREDEPFFEANIDSMDAVDWISVEGTMEHTEWEQPKLSPGVLMKALHEIRQLTCGTGDVPENHIKALQLIYAVATKAIAEAVPQD